VAEKEMSYDEFINEINVLFDNSSKEIENGEGNLLDQFRIFAIERAILMPISFDLMCKVENANSDDSLEARESEFLSEKPIYARSYGLNLERLVNSNLDRDLSGGISLRNYNELLESFTNDPMRMCCINNYIFELGSSNIIKEDTARNLYEELLVPYYKDGDTLLRPDENGNIEPYFPRVRMIEDSNDFDDFFDEDFDNDYSLEVKEEDKEGYINAGVSDEQFKAMLEFTKNMHASNIVFTPKEAIFLDKVNNLFKVPHIL